MNLELKLKLEAIEDDKALLAALGESSDDDSCDEPSSDESDSDDAAEEPQEDVKPSIKTEGGAVEASGEFERLVDDIRLNEGSSSAGMLAKDWDFSIYDTTEYLHDLRTASGVGRRWRKSDRAYGPALSFQTKTLLGEGNQAYVDGDLPSAIRIMLEVIRIEPRAASAWSVLAQCYEDQKELSKALQLRIMGAHLKHDAELWDRLARQSRELGYPQQALYCWAKAYNIDPTNVAALWDRAMLAKELGDLNTTRLAFLGILERFPHDLNILSELRTVLVDLGDLDTCASLFQAAFDHYQAAFPSGSGRAAASGQDAPGAGFALLEVLVLADLYNTLGEHERAVDVIRKGARWLQGRAAQAHWDLCEDDREFDCEIADVARAVDATDDIEPGYYELDVNARHRLAVARIKMGEIEEGKIHAEIVLSQDILDYAPLFCEIADAYFELDLFVEARAIYELLGAHDTTSSVYVLMQTAACLRNTDELQDAADVYEAVRKVDPTHNEAKMKLAEVYEILDQPRKALELVYEVIDARRRRPKEVTAAVTDDIAPAVPALINDKPVKPRAKQPKKASTNRLSNAELRELEAKKEVEVTAGYRRLKELWPRMLQGEGEPRQEWMVETDKLVEAFRETRRLFSTSRTFKGMFPVRRTGVKTEEGEEDRILSRLQIDLAHDTTARKTRSGDKYNRVDVFRGINFDDWLRLFIQYSFVLTQQGNYDLADEILRHLLASSAYQLPDIQDAIRIALMTCASNAGRFHVVVEQARKLLAGHQFHNEPLRIMVAALGSGLGPSDAFLATTFQKYLHREVKMFDAAVNNPEALVWSVQGRRFSTKAVAGAQDWGDDEELDGEDEKKPGRKAKRPPRLPDIAKTPNPVVLALYGQVCLVAKSFQSATFYLLMAHDHCPEDPMISICITISSLGRAAQRQCDNRHHLITQAMAFLARYRAYRALSGDHTVEIEYNMGRTFHQLALYSHAARHYERALDAAAKSTKPVDITCAAEAAYNLSMIYVATGARTLAVQLYRRWLSF